MNVLITGGAGLIGSHAAECWAGQGHDVTVLDNLARSRLFGWPKETVEYTWRHLAQQERIRLVEGDVRRREDLDRAIGDGVDVVLHAAAQPGVAFSIRNPQEDFTVNTLGTLHVLEAVRARAPKACVLHCSTNKVYGTNVSRLPLTEEDRRYAFLRNGTPGVSEDLPIDLAGHTPYGVSKLASELYVQEYAHTYGLRTAVFRLSCVYGDRQFGFEDQGWIAHFLISALLGRPVTIYGDGKQVRDILHVDDLVLAFDGFLASALRHGVFNIGGGPAQTISLLELLDWLERATGRVPVVTYRAWRPSDQKVYVSDLTRAQDALQWRPRIRPAEGLERLLRWISDHRELF